MLFVVLRDGSIFQQHVSDKRTAENMLSYLDHSWAEWMGERIYPECWY